VEKWLSVCVHLRYDNPGREADLVIATFGRAIYVLDNIRPLREIAKNKGILTADKRVTAFPTGDVIQAEYRNAPGYEWSTWGIWDATNREAGAPLSFYVNYLPVILPKSSN
jgi:hypothetical protein